MKMKATGLAAAVILASGPSAWAQEVVPKEVSPLRVVDKSGAKVGNYVWGLALPELGVGNVIFSSNPVPYGKEAEYTQVDTRFDVTTAPALYHRAYLPGTVESMIKFIEAKRPGLKFRRKFELIAFKEAGSTGAPREIRNNTILTTAGAGMSTHWNQYWPKNDYSLAVLNLAKAKKGEHQLRVTVCLEFDTGKTRIVTEMRDNRLVTETVPILHDVAIAYGTCTLVNP